MEASDWQTQLSSVRERNLYALNNNLFCDVAFSVEDSNGDKVTIQANKYVLAISSPVFEAMFYGELAETSRTIDLPDCTKEGLQELLRYVYSDEVNLTGSNIMSVIYVADKYMVPFLMEKCYEYLQKELEPEEVFIALPQAQQSGNEKVEKCCWNIVDFETEEAVTSESFLNISRELLCQVLARDTLHVEEIDLFQAVDRWASNQIKEKDLKDDGTTKRDVLGDNVVQRIRFPVMSPKEFAEFVMIREILHGNEVTEIVQILSNLAPSGTAFNTKKRDGQWNERWSANRCRSIESNTRKKTGLLRHSIQLQVSKPIFLAGVRLFGDRYQPNTIVNLSIYKTNFRHNRSFKASYNFNDTKFIDDLYYGYTVMVDGPVPLEPDEWYTIEAELRGQFAGSEGQDVVKCDDITITFKNAADTNHSTVEKGQFPSFLLKRKIKLQKKRKRSESDESS
jgi:hypothetical protein